jgi:hypothetical protein
LLGEDVSGPGAVWLNQFDGLAVAPVTAQVVAVLALLRRRSPDRAAACGCPERTYRGTRSGTGAVPVLRLGMSDTFGILSNLKGADSSGALSLNRLQKWLAPGSQSAARALPLLG